MSAVTRLEAASCCAPVTSLTLEPAVMIAGMTMRRATPLSVARRLRGPACDPCPPLSSASASWNQMARPGPSSASEVTHGSLCMGKGDVAELDSTPCRRRRRASQKPEPSLSDSSKNTVFPAMSVVLLSCTCSSGRPMEHASPERSESASAGDDANTPASGIGIAMPNSTAAGSIAAGALLALGEAVEVPVADEPAVELADGLSVSGADTDAVPDGEPVDDRVRAGVRVRDVGGVPVCEGDGVPVVEPVADAGGVTLLDGLALPVPEEEAPAVSELDDVLVALVVLSAVPEAVPLVVSSGEPLRVELDVGLLVLVGEPLGRADFEPVLVRLGVPVAVAGGVDVSVAVAGGVPEAETVPDAVADDSAPFVNEAVAVTLSLPVAVTEAALVAVTVNDVRADLVADLELDRLRDAVPEGVTGPVPVADNELEPVADDDVVLAPDGELLPVPVFEPVALLEPEPVELLEPVSVALLEPVLVKLIEPVAVALLEPVPVVLPEPVPVADDELLPVADDELVLVPVGELLPVPVDEPVALLEPVAVALDEAD